MKWYIAWRLRMLRKKIDVLQVYIDEMEIMITRIEGADGYRLNLAKLVLKTRITIGKLHLKEKELSK